MSEKRVLRDRTVVSNIPANVSNKKYAFFKSKSNDKENHLHAGIKGINYYSHDKFVAELQKHKKNCSSTSKRNIVKQSFTTKVKLCSKKEKDSRTSNMLKQKQNTSDGHSLKIKGRQSPKSTEYKKNTVLSSAENKYSEKNTKKKINKIALNLIKTPIWNRNLDVSNLHRKRRCVDVYDISMDEELAFSETCTKKRIKVSKKKKDVGKKKHSFFTTAHLKSKLTTKELPDSKSTRPVPLETNQITMNIFEHNETQELPFEQNACDKEVYVDQNLFSVSSPNNTIETVQHTFTDAQPSSILKDKDKNKLYISHLADELEKSFSFPEMTSTPEDGIHLKSGAQIQKGIADISIIPPNNANCLDSNVVTHVSSDRDTSPEMNKEIEEIILFESPKKPSKKSPQKTIQINLFGEVLRTPSSVESLEESVVKTKKAYHTPDNFKVHLIRINMPSAKKKKEPKKSKQDHLIEEMSQHFDEIEKTELCIE